MVVLVDNIIINFVTLCKNNISKYSYKEIEQLFIFSSAIINHKPCNLLTIIFLALILIK